MTAVRASIADRLLRHGRLRPRHHNAQTDARPSLSLRLPGRAIRSGLQTGLAAVGSAFSGGLWDGGQWRCQPGFGTSPVLAGIGRDALLAAAGMGEGAELEGLEEVGSATRVAEEEGDAAATANQCADGMQCFAPGTPVQMADGTTQPIEAVKVGESVLSRDQDDAAGTGTVTAHKVTQTFQNVVAEGTLVLHLSGGESVEATPGHRFFVAGRGFTQASLIAVGNAIVTRAGPSSDGKDGGKPSSVVVERIEVKPGRATVYNLEVEGSHTFFVGKTEGGLWTHNTCGSGGSPALKGDPYSPDSVEARIRPPYEVNPKHVPGSGHYIPVADVLPSDAEAAYAGAEQSPMGTWWAKGQEGWYRYFSDNAGTAHSSGTIPRNRVPAWILRGE